MCICSSIDINIWVETGEPSKGPNGENVPVGDGACLVEHAFDPLLHARVVNIRDHNGHMDTSSGSLLAQLHTSCLSLFKNGSLL